MRARLVIIGAATWLIASACGDARPCEAGFLGAADAAQWLSESGGASAISEQSRDFEPGHGAPDVEFEPAVNALVGEGSASSVPTNSVVQVSLGSAFAALPETCRPGSISVTEQLQIAESALIPPVYLSNVFRPPRV